MQRPLSVQGRWRWRICRKQCFTVCRAQWSAGLDLMFLDVGCFKVMQCLEDRGPVVSGQVVLELVKVECCRSKPLWGWKITSMWNIISSGVHAVTSLYLEQIISHTCEKDVLTHSCGCKGQGTNRTTPITRISGRDWCLDPIGGEVDGECLEDRHRLEWAPSFLPTSLLIEFCQTDKKGLLHHSRRVHQGVV